MPLSRRLPLVLAVTALAASALLVPGRAASAGPDRATPARSAGATVVKAAARSAQLIATVSTRQRTTVRYEYGRTTAYGRATAPVVVRGTPGAAQLVKVVGGLVPGTAYHVRLVAEDGQGRVTGPDTRFVTAGVQAPTS